MPTGQTTEFYYDESGQPIRMNVKNSANTSSFSVYQSYDDAGRLTGQHVVDADALDLTYAYDADGNIVNYFDGTNPHTFTYDLAGRLASWTYQGNTVQYDYDAAGNLKNPHGKTLTFNAANEVEGFSYDEAGNLLQDDKYQYEWDGEGRLLTVKDLNGNAIASFTYHPDGLRKTKTLNGVTYHYHYDGSDLIRITDDNGQTVWAFTWANGKPNTVTNSNGDTFYYVTNYRGDVVRIVNENGTTVASYSYDPWGKVLSVSEDAAVAGQPLGYAGYYYDKETKLYYLQARYYDPETARFISRDADPGDIDDPFTQNGYIYANSNPVMYVDPDGQKRRQTGDWGEDWFEAGMCLKNYWIYGDCDFDPTAKKKKSKGKGKLIKFNNERLLLEHFDKHGKEIMDALGKSKYTLKDYLQDANHVIRNGQYVPELNGYVKLIGGKGSAKYAFVGLDRKTGNITTFHIKTAKELSKKAPSLGIRIK